MSAFFCMLQEENSCVPVSFLVVSSHLTHVPLALLN